MILAKEQPEIVTSFFRDLIRRANHWLICIVGRIDTRAAKGRGLFLGELLPGRFFET
jgi:hypothetical protein